MDGRAAARSKPAHPRPAAHDGMTTLMASFGCAAMPAHSRFIPGSFVKRLRTM
jgi:hypothetical protein